MLLKTRLVHSMATGVLTVLFYLYRQSVQSASVPYRFEITSLVAVPDEAELRVPYWSTKRNRSSS